MAYRGDISRRRAPSTPQASPQAPPQGAITEQSFPSVKTALAQSQAQRRITRMNTTYTFRASTPPDADIEQGTVLVTTYGFGDHPMTDALERARTLLPGWSHWRLVSIQEVGAVR